MEIPDITKLFKSKAWDILISEEPELAGISRNPSVLPKQEIENIPVNPTNNVDYLISKQEELIKKINENMNKIVRRIEKRTEKIDYYNDVVENDEKIYLDLQGLGTIKEILVIADRPDFRVSISSDDEWVINDDFNTLSDYSTYIKLFDAFTDGNKYIFAASDISFLKRLKFSLITYAKVTFSKVYASYDVRYKWEGV